MIDISKKCTEFRLTLDAAKEYKDFFDEVYPQVLEDRDWSNPNLAHAKMNCAYQIGSLRKKLFWK